MKNVQALNFLIIVIIILIVTILALLSNTLKLWILCSVVASIAFPTLMNYFSVSKEISKKTLNYSKIDNIKNELWKKYGRKYFFIDTELILISIILGFDTIGDIFNKILSLENSPTIEQNGSISITLLCFIVIVEFFMVSSMAFYYGIKSKEPFFPSIEYFEDKKSMDQAEIENIYINELVIIFSPFVVNLVYLTVIQYILYQI